MSNLCLFRDEKSRENLSLQDELTYQRKAELKLAVHCTRRHFRSPTKSMKITAVLGPLQLEFRSRIVEMDADERDGAAQPSSRVGGVDQTEKKTNFFSQLSRDFSRKKTLEKSMFDL